ncbi:hypothetical protein [Actinomadura sp. SCN-SB]|uniref:hypothetical protein n=1 Tax=Actinomadura sp. SCN-SB TaxID=3373092 RepID=UPI003751FCD5
MTKNRDRKQAIRALATEKNISYQQAERLYDVQRAQRRADTQHDAPVQNAAQGLVLRSRDVHTLEMWDERNASFTDEVQTDPYQRQGALESRALLWGDLGADRVADQARDAGNTELGRLLDRLATATAYAAILDQEQAARIRYEHRIPTLDPGVRASLAAQPRRRLRAMPCVLLGPDPEQPGQCREYEGRRAPGLRG